MSQNEPEQPKEYKFISYCFSTNNQNFNAISVMKQYLMSTDCQEVNYTNNEKQVEFIHEISGEKGIKIECHNKYKEIYPLHKNSKGITKVIPDCYIIFFDLENNESLMELNKIINFLSDCGESDKKTYLIKIYTNENNIKDSLTDDNIKIYMEKYVLTNYDIFMVNIDSSVEIVKVIDSLTEETLQEKYSFNTFIEEKDPSKSGCLIF